MKNIGRNIFLSLGLSIIIGVVVGLIFYQTKYYYCYPSQPQIEITQTLYTSFKDTEDTKKSFLVENYFNTSYALVSGSLCFGILLVIYNLKNKPE